jgi:hypothetical protein
MSTESSTERIRAFLEEWIAAIDPATANMDREQLVACCVEAGIPQADVDPLVDDLLRGRAAEPVSRVERRRELCPMALEPEDASRVVDELFAQFEGDGSQH